MASSPGDLPPREQLELFGGTGQGAPQFESDMAKKSEKKAWTIHNDYRYPVDSFWA